MSNESSESSPKAETCAICQFEITDPYETTCGHTYCYMCLVNMATKERETFCPQCRKNISEERHNFCYKTYEQLKAGNSFYSSEDVSESQLHSNDVGNRQNMYEYFQSHPLDFLEIQSHSNGLGSYQEIIDDRSSNSRLDDSEIQWHSNDPTESIGNDNLHLFNFINLLNKIFCLNKLLPKNRISFSDKSDDSMIRRKRIFKLVIFYSIFLVLLIKIF